MNADRSLRIFRTFSKQGKQPGVVDLWRQEKVCGKFRGKHRVQERSLCY